MYSMTNTVANDPEALRQQIQQQALYFLARREYSFQELSQRLQRKSFPKSMVETVLTTLSEQGLQSDARFAQSFARHRASQAYGPLRIEMELQQRGVADGLVQPAIWGQDEIDWDEVLRRAFTRRFSAKATDLKEKSKQWRYLQYRGFTSDQIKSVIK